MAFYICPFNKITRQLFRANPKKFRRNRKPLALRAGQARLKAAVSANKNTFSITGHKSDAAQRIAQNIEKHFGAIFDGKKINIDIKYHQKDESFTVVITVTDNSPRTPVLSAFFTLFTRNKMLYLMNINSEGYGGQGTIALYNLAKDFGMKEITFITSTENRNAKQFYYHMDFGRPTDGSWARWEVTLP
jgi:hypothetical protein